MASAPIDAGHDQDAAVALLADRERQSEGDLLDTLHLGSLLQAPALIALLHGPDHVYQFVNERYIRVIGDRNYIGRPVREVVPEAVDQGLVAILDRVYATGEPFVATEMPLQFTQGTAGTLQEGFYTFIYQPLGDGRGAVTGIMLHAVEVTEQVRTRSRFEQLAVEHTATLNQMADGVIVVDTTGLVTFQNEAARRLLGIDGVGLPLEDWLQTIELLTLDGAALPVEDTWLAQTVQGGEPKLDVERRIRRPDGTEIVVHGSAAPVIAEDGSRYGSVFTFRDITEQKKLEEARFALAALVESSSDAIIRATLDGIITAWDRGAEQLYGYSASEAIGQPTGMIVPTDRADELSRVLAQVRAGNPVEHIETVRRHKDGQLIDISVSVSPIKNVFGATTGALSIAHDIGKRKRLERERTQHQQELTTRVLQAQEDERKRIARDLHDETLQALTTLLITLDLAERRLPDGTDDTASVLARVRSIARRALDETRTLAHSLRPPILDDLGLVAALQALGEEYMQTFHVHILVESGSGTENTVHVAPSIETVLFRVAQEALTNACKHAGANEVRISFTIRGGYGMLSVADNGHGFDLQQSTSPGRHTGLGLDGMRERAALVGGDLHIDTTPGAGTRVTLRVRVNEELSRSPVEERGDDGRSAGPSSSLNVLLVDDHAMVREGLKLVLETQPGIQVAGEAEDGHQALELVEQLHPDVVVMDIAMPNLNGFDATRQIKRRFPEVKVLILTSHENRQYVTQIVKTGADGCLLKRSAGTELVAALETVQAGRSYVSPSVTGTLLDDYRVRVDHGGEDLLTEREREVVQLVAEGHTNRGIAHKLGISVKTVETHRTNIMEKLGAADRTDLVKYAIRTGMITPE